MKKAGIICCLAMLLLAGCMPNVSVVTTTPGSPVTDASATSAPPESSPTTGQVMTATPLPPPTDVTVVTATTEPAASTGQPAMPLPIAQNDFFGTSGRCSVCHINNVDEAGADVDIVRQWRSTMMANAGRDPYWQAGVRTEAINNPDYAEFIEDKCSTCHMPMARFTRYVAEEPGQVFSETGFLNPENDLHILAMDGVSCSLCHQIESENFGELEGFSGHYVIDPTVPADERRAYGPYPIDETQAVVMQAASGHVPTESAHIRESELCASCHTLYTPTIDAEGEIVGEFAEQMPYVEWLHSDYRETDSCLDCHMPEAEGGVVLSITGGELRSPYMQHILVGGNTYTPQIFQQFGDELGVVANTEQFDYTIAQARELLQNSTATVTVDSATIAESTLAVDVTITSQTGHKIPSGYPARRTWLHVTVYDTNGQIVFESGGFSPDGAIQGNDNDADGALYEPHYEVISNPDEVQIYEAIMVDAAGNVTTRLLSGAGYVKDNRLLPTGFDKTTATDDIAVLGAAFEDADFVGGSDHIRYAIDLGEAEGPFTVMVELLYQPIAYRWAQNLRGYDLFETERFLRYYEAVSNIPTVITSVTMETDS